MNLDASPARRGVVLATVCLAVFAINLDVTIVNVALPDLGRQLRASTKDLQWVVDGYNLAFAALVLTAGSLGDRFGRRPALLLGLLGFAAASGVGAAVGTPAALIAVRFVMGAFAALIYPTTLSVINNVFPDRGERAKAIGLWGAVTGLGVAVGPVTGGLLLAHFAWPSVFIALVPVALIGAGLAFAFVPESSNPAEAHVDIPGLISSSAAISSLVYTIIEAPARGWGSVPTLLGFAITAALVMWFIVLEYRSADPMLDVSLFRTPAFSAASGAVTVCFFALYGFIFLITQYFQFVRGYGTLSTGARILPVAVTIAIGSVVGVQLAGRIGTRPIVVTGLVLFAASFAWMSVATTFIPYRSVIGIMVLMGLGLGLTSAPATESILSVLPPAKTGVGSAVNDATREAGGTLGVAVIGSVFLSLYAHRIDATAFAADLPAAAHGAARSSVAAAIQTLAHTPAGLQQRLLADFNSSFMSGLHTACIVAAAVCLLGAIGSLALPGRPNATTTTGSDTPAGEPTALPDTGLTGRSNQSSIGARCGRGTGRALAGGNRRPGPAPAVTAHGWLLGRVVAGVPGGGRYGSVGLAVVPQGSQLQGRAGEGDAAALAGGVGGSGCGADERPAAGAVLDEELGVGAVVLEVDLLLGGGCRRRLEAGDCVGGRAAGTEVAAAGHGRACGSAVGVLEGGTYRVGDLVVAAARCGS